MKINIGEMIASLERDGVKAYGKLNDLVECIKQIQEDWRDKNFIEVRVFNDNGNITSLLRTAFPKYDIWWEGDLGYCGENIVLVPSADWNDELEKKLAEFDSAAGHHKKTQQEWRLKDGVKLPRDLAYDIENFKRDILNNTGKMPEVVQIPGYGFSQWPWQRYESVKTEYFDEVQTVIREWDEKLNIIDRRKWAKYDETMKAKAIEI